MFRIQSTAPAKTYRLAMLGLLSLSVTALAITMWAMVDLLNEQAIVQKLIRDLPPQDLPAAETLAGDIRWQFRLTALIVVNLVATGIAVVYLWRAYQTSQGSLRDFKALAGDILGSMDQGVITTDLNGTITSFNSRAIDLLCVDGDPVGMPIASLTTQIDLAAFRHRSDLHCASRNTLAATIENFYVQMPDGQRCLRTFCQPLRDVDDVTIGNILQLRDVTEQIHLENQMRRMERFMGLGSLAAGLHHEIKNPLAALSLHVQLLEEQLDDPSDPDEVQQMLQVIKTEVSRIGSVLEGFRDFASIGRLHREQVELRELVEQQVTLIGPRAQRLGVELAIRLANDPTSPLVIDRVRIQQVLLNLMLNALQAMPAGGTLTIQSQRTVLNGADAILLTVSDTGGGIPESVQSRIFDPYFTTKNDGTGMGLALSDKIVRQHGGSLDFESSADGTTFTMTLPMDASDRESEIIASDPAKA